MQVPCGSLAAAIVLVALSSACAPFRPAVVVGLQSPPARDGVALSVASVLCSENVDPDWPGANLVDAIVEVRVDNRSGATVVVRRGAFRLVAPDGRAIPASSWGQVQPLQIAANASQAFRLRFSTRGGLSCAGPMRLESAS